MLHQPLDFIGENIYNEYQKRIQKNGAKLMKNKQNSTILFLEPVMKQMVWGGNRLREEFGYEIPGEDTGECWAVSAHPNGDCTIRGGAFEGKALSELWEGQRILFGKVEKDRFPLLVKIIDAKDDLSIQVHPDDQYAKVHENGSLGKTECWYILDAPKEAQLVIGHSAKTRAELSEMILEDQWEELLEKVPVRKGDFIQIDPGTVHAITAGIMILEIQQNSDVTYRLYDYGRLSGGIPRELHLKQSMEVIKVPSLDVEKMVSYCDDLPKDALNQLVACEYYVVWKLEVEKGVRFRQEYPFLIVNVLEGEGLINGQDIKKGDHFILPAEYGEVELKGEVSMILSTIPEKQIV